MVDELDYIDRFAKAKNFEIRSRNVFVEGTTDVDIFKLAAKLEKEKTGLDLLGDSLAIISAGEKGEGGVSGVIRELVSFSNMAKYLLLPNGRPKYRFIGLFDNDNAGRRARNQLNRSDTSLLEFKDILCLWPMMPNGPSRHPDKMRTLFESANEKYKGLDWEMEDLLPDEFLEVFINENPSALYRRASKFDKIHRDWAPNGKAKLHHFIKQHATHSDLKEVISVLKIFWHMFGLQFSN